LPEVAVLGRSNVGKSTLINRLVGRKGLARTSATPGRTRRIHFYRVDERAYLVDLPGFGYASGSKTERAAFAPLVESYLTRSRVSLRGALVLIDARRGVQEDERELARYLAAEGIAARVALTKCDKLGRAEVARARREVAEKLGLDEAHVAAVSAQQSSGLGPVAAWLREWSGVAFKRADGLDF
jgi:GTP-binding protein